MSIYEFLYKKDIYWRVMYFFIKIVVLIIFLVPMIHSWNDIRYFKNNYHENPSIVYSNSQYEQFYKQYGILPPDLGNSTFLQKYYKDSAFRASNDAAVKATQIINNNLKMLIAIYLIIYILDIIYYHYIKHKVLNRPFLELIKEYYKKKFTFKKKELIS
jgi:hypothetical protein